MANLALNIKEGVIYKVRGLGESLFVFLKGGENYNLYFSFVCQF